MTQIEDEAVENSNDCTDTTNEIPKKGCTFILENILFLMMMAGTLSGTAVSNILLNRTCRHVLHYSDYECAGFLSPDKSNITRELEQEVQKYTTFISTVKTVLEAILPAILSLFLGVWSDIHGRKPLIVWPLWGTCISSMMTVIYCVVDSFGPWWYIISVIPLSLTGGITVLFTGAICYLNDVTTTESKSFRMTILEITISVGNIVGLLLSSYLLKLLGSIYLLLLVAAIFTIAYAIGNMFLPESLSGAVSGDISSALDISLVKQMFKECFKSRPNHGRAHILLLASSNTLLVLIMYGVYSLEYMYTREKLHWSMKDHNTYSAVNTVVSAVGGFIAIVLLQKKLRLTDMPVVIMAVASSGAEYLVKTFATMSWHMYFGGALSMFRGISGPLIRSFLGKTFSAEDVGKVFTLMCAFQGLCPLLAPTIYNSLYAYTVSTFSGAIYLLSTGFVIISIIMLGFVQYYSWKDFTYQTLEEEAF